MDIDIDVDIDIVIVLQGDIGVPELRDWSCSLSVRTCGNPRIMIMIMICDL